MAASTWPDWFPYISCMKVDGALDVDSEKFPEMSAYVMTRRTNRFEATFQWVVGMFSDGSVCLLQDTPVHYEGHKLK